MSPKESLNVLVVGETGDGKSMLLKALLDKSYYKENQDELPEVLDRSTRSAGGTTLDVAKYHGMKFGNKKLVLYDTPGAGTEKTPIDEIVAMIKAELDDGTKFQCILVTAPTTTETPGAGAQIVRLLLAEGLCGDDADAWNHVILVGTKADRADATDLQRFEHALVPKFFEAAPPGCDRKYCFTSAKDKDDHGNARELMVNDLVIKLKHVSGLGNFFFKDLGLSRDIVEKICVKIMGRGVEEAKRMADKYEDLVKLERENRKHLPGADKINEEKQLLKRCLSGELFKPTSHQKKDLKARNEFLYEHVEKRVNPPFTRMTLQQMQAEAVREKLIKKLPVSGKYPRGEGWRFAAPPHGRKPDIAWALYVHKFKEDVQTKYKLETSLTPAKAPLAAAVGSAKKRKRTLQSEDMPTRPRGRAPAGKKWDYEVGDWVACA